MSQMQLTPRQIVHELDRFIVGQDEAKKAVAIALRNRYRRSRVEETLRDEIIPKNILMIGPTGVGKTEIARRLARLVNAPFIKVEATKFTEVGYVGRDVESIIRDLTENAVRMVRKEHEERVMPRARVLAEERLSEMLAHPAKKTNAASNPLDFLLGKKKEEQEEYRQPQQGTGKAELKEPGGEAMRIISGEARGSEEEISALAKRKEDIRQQLMRNEIEDLELDLEVEEESPTLEVGGSSISLGDMMGNMMPRRTRIRHVKVHEARKIITDQEAAKLIDNDAVQEEAIRRTEQDGIVFIDEIDKIASSSNVHGPDVSREGVQRDILPIVEGCTVNTKYGAVRTDYMLFIAAGAFHVSKVSDLIPELQGRFPVHVHLKSLTKEDFRQILTVPENALTKQYRALLEVDKVLLRFDDSAIDAIAAAACNANDNAEDIGARRLHAIFEQLLEDVSFNAGDENMPPCELVIDSRYVDEHMKGENRPTDMRKYIL